MPILPVREWPLLLARSAFLMMMVAGVALWGGTQTGSQSPLEWALIAVSVLYVIGGAISADRLRITPWLLGGAVILLALGWLSALSPASVFDLEGRVFLPISPRPRWPWGTVDPGISTDTMRRITGMLGALLMARDMGSHAGWRRTALTTMAWCGVAEAAFGFVQRMDGDLGNYWGTVGTQRFRDTVFGCFWYHGNAGAFLNLCWPLMAALTWQEFKRPSSTSVAQQFRRAVLFLALLVILSAVWANHSRAAQAIFVVQSLLILGLSRSLENTRFAGRLRMAGVLAVTFVAAVTVLTMESGLDKSLEKWTHFGNGGLTSDGRWAVLQTCAKWFGEIPLLGYGPGTFTAVFIVKTTGMSDAPTGYWQFAHDDYLQTFLEWGWVGLVLWLALGIAILFSIFGRLGKANRAGAVQQPILLLAVGVALLSVAAHAAVDFPLQIFAIQLYAASLAGIGISDAGESKQRRRRHGERSHEDHAGAP